MEFKSPKKFMNFQLPHLTNKYKKHGNFLEHFQLHCLTFLDLLSPKNKKRKVIFT